MMFAVRIKAIRKDFNEDDLYGLSKQEMEVDSDVNEDPNRERLLDESVESFMNSLIEE